MVRKWAFLAMAGWAGAALADPPPVLRAEVESRAEAMFAKSDANHDGFLTREEYHATILARAKQFDAKVTPGGLKAADAMFDSVDIQHSGRVSHADFIAAALAHFDGADLNHDGKVTPDEARKAAKIKQKAIQAPPAR